MLTTSTPARTVSGRVESVMRHGNTPNGNPRVSVVLRITAIDGVPAKSSEPVTVRVQDDASLAGELGNRELRDTAHTFALTPAGRISHRIR